MRRLVAVVVLLALVPARAWANPLFDPTPPKVDPDPPLFWSVAAGFATAIVPLAVGGSVLATAGENDDSPKRIGVHLIIAGLALAPIVSHLISREWKRAAIFAAAPLACAAVAIGLLEGTPNLLDEGAPPPRIAFGAALALEIVATGIGLVDSLMIKDRARKTHVAVVPTFGRDQIGLSIGGTL